MLLNLYRKPFILAPLHEYSAKTFSFSPENFSNSCFWLGSNKKNFPLISVMANACVSRLSSSAITTSAFSSPRPASSEHRNTARSSSSPSLSDIISAGVSQ
ncbi:MAG: hAT transposon family protein [Candidatus Diapherotrites archaeon]|nr:hAT transposon family protein [Candidatus Diapherotrites archaeon]